MGCGSSMCSTPQAQMTLAANAEFHEGVDPSPELAATVSALDGLDRFAARKRVVEMMEERELLDGRRRP